MCGVGKIYCQLLQDNYFAFTVFISIYKFLLCYQKGSTTNTFSQWMVLMLNTCLSWTDISLHQILNALSLSSPGISRTSWYLLLKLCFPLFYFERYLSSTIISWIPNDHNSLNIQATNRQDPPLQVANGTAS